MGTYGHLWALIRHENMTYSQKDRLDRIQHTLLPTTEKNFIENERKMPIFDIFFGWQQLMLLGCSISCRRRKNISKIGIFLSFLMKFFSVVSKSVC